MTSFCTAVNCIDGRTHLPVAKHLRRLGRVRHVDMVTCPGPARTLAEQHDRAAIEMIFRGVRASLHHHESRLVAVAAHHDCAASPVDREVQLGHVETAVAALRRRFQDVSVLGLWVDGRGRVTTVTEADRIDAS